ncbi:hypothetical protein HY024_03230 [Candidatus Curtissbacteria bacterium]|nr:hypothetical protein [Candidatus Curtissbacteria bacterium]
MLRYPKYALGLLITAAVVLFLIISFFFTKKTNVSKFNLSSENNKFRLQFNISQKDQNNFAKFLENVSLPSNTEKGITFGLDATSSAILNFQTPIEGQLNLSATKITTTGNLNFPLVTKNISSESFLFPKNLSFAIAGPNLGASAATYLNLPPKVKATIEENSASGGQILAFFGQAVDGVYIFKTGNFDIESFKDANPQGGLVYKEETTENTKFSLINNLASFQVGDWTIMASSLENAKTMLAQQKDPKDSIYFPPQTGSTTPTIALLFQNPVPEQLLSTIFGNKEKIPAFLANIQKIDFAAKNQSFNLTVTARDK